MALEHFFGGPNGRASSLHVSEDEVKKLHEEIQELLKKYEKETDDLVAAKSKEIETI